MNRKQLGKVLDRLHIEQVIDYDGNVQIPCLMAKWRAGHTSGSDHSGSMGISVNEKGKPSLVNCFSCKFKGTLSYLLFKYEQMSKKPIKELRDWVDDIEDGDPVQMILDLGDFGAQEETEVFHHRYLCDGLLDMFFTEVETSYLESRGISLDTLKAWGCLYDQKYSRVVFPVRAFLPESNRNCAHNKSLVGAIGRAVGNSDVKYFNYFKFQKKHYFFGEHMASRNTVAVVVEGVLDTVMVWQELKKEGMLGEYSVLGLMGSSASKAQERRLYEEFTSVVSFFDNDPAGWTGQRGLIQGIQDKTLLRGVRYPREEGFNKSDPADLVQKGVSVAKVVRDAGLIAV